MQTLEKRDDSSHVSDKALDRKEEELFFFLFLSLVFALPVVVI